MATTYDTIEAQFTSSYSGVAIMSAGGVCQVNVAGTAHKATLYDPDNNYAALANPITPTRGKIRFAVQNSVVPITVDLYGMSPAGHFFVFRSATPGNPLEILIDGNRRDEVAIIPFATADCTVATEKDTGFAFPSGAIITPRPAVNISVVATTGSKTIDVGLLSSQSGGDANGFVEAISLTSLATIAAKLASTGTLGALVRETTTGASAVIPVPYVIGATAKNVSYTLLTGTLEAEGYLIIPYQLTVA